MKKLVINADDFGYREGINRGIVYAHQNGLVTSASLFVEREASEEAVRLARENPGLGLGLHLDLDRFFHIDHGQGIVTGFITPRPSIDEIRGECRRQIEKFNSFGFIADHIDSHHHSHLTPELFPVVCELAKEYRIPVVRFFCKYYPDQSVCDAVKKAAEPSGRHFVDHFIEGWYWGNVDEPYNVAELMTHPGYGELWREAELAHCCQSTLKQYFVDQNIELLRFGDIFPSS